MENVEVRSPEQPKPTTTEKVSRFLQKWNDKLAQSVIVPTGLAIYATSQLASGNWKTALGVGIGYGAYKTASELWWRKVNKKELDALDEKVKKEPKKVE